MVTGTYTAYYLGPKKCFKGKVSSINNFYADATKPYTQGGTDVGQPNYDNTLKQYDVSSRSDYEDLKPCCSMTNSWAATGISFDQSGNTGKDGTTGTASGGGGTGGTSGTADKLGTCSGTDNKGKACPPDYDAERPCPPGCTSSPYSSTTGNAGSGGTTAAGSGSYQWTTSNALGYMCSSDLDLTGRELTCGQAEYPAGQNEGADATIACSSGSIECFVFASVGLVGGSCSGDPFAEDPNNQWAYMPLSVGNACVGQSSCAVSVGDGTLNGQATSPSTAGYAKSKFKGIALCSTSSASVSTSASSGASVSTTGSSSVSEAPSSTTGSMESTTGTDAEDGESTGTTTRDKLVTSAGQSFQFLASMVVATLATLSVACH